MDKTALYEMTTANEINIIWKVLIILLCVINIVLAASGNCIHVNPIGDGYNVKGIT